MPGLGQNFGQRRQQPERCDDRHMASILGLTSKTVKALISGHPAFVPKLTLYETAPPMCFSSKLLYASANA